MAVPFIVLSLIYYIGPDHEKVKFATRPDGTLLKNVQVYVFTC